MLARVLVTVALGLGVLAGPQASAAEPLVDVLPTKRWAFSPNGDGHKDTLPVRFRLQERAHVTVRIPRVGAVDLGVRGPGRHRWVWDGRGAPTDSYRIRVDARTPDGRTGSDFRYAELDRGEEIAAVQVRMTRRTLYPATPGKHDEIWVHSTHAGNATEVTIRDAAGDVVVEDELRQWWSWDGDGLPPGDYTAAFFVHDRAGNRRFIDRPITISPEHLHQETWSTTATAADVELFPWACGTSPSARYERGVAVAPAPSCQYGLLPPHFPIPVEVDPDVTYRLTVAGAGGPAEVFISSGTNVVATPTPVGEGVTTTPWGSPSYVEWAREPEAPGWVVVREGSYDVAELTLEVRYWTASDAAAPTAARVSAPRGPAPSPATAPSR